MRRYLPLGLMALLSFACGGGGGDSAPSSNTIVSGNVSGNTVVSANITWEKIVIAGSSELIATRVVKDEASSNIYFSYNNLSGNAYKTADLSTFTQTKLNAGSHSIVRADKRLFTFSSYSDDNGSTWTNFKDASNADVRFLTVDGSGNSLVGVHQTSNQVYYSVNSGNTWASANLNVVGLSSFLVDLTSHPAVKGQTVMIPHTSAGVFVSTQGGNNFTLKNVGLTNIDVVAPSGNSNSFFAGSKTGFFKTEDNGATWISLTKASTASTFNGWYALTVVSDDLILGIVNYSSLGFINDSFDVVKSTDGGTTWTKVGSTFAMSMTSGVPSDVAVTSTHFLINGSDTFFYKFKR